MDLVAELVVVVASGAFLFYKLAVVIENALIRGVDLDGTE
jgi:hypothetical protein